MINFFTWFYCLDISAALLLVIAATASFLYLRYQLELCRYWRPVLALLLLLWAAVVITQTVLLRTSGVQRALVLVPFQSYLEVLAGGNMEILRSDLMNVLLFYPAGLLGASLLPKRWHPLYKVFPALLFSVLLSIGIECCQYHFALGLTEVDDIIHNTLGTLLGALVGTLDIKASSVS